MSTAGSPSPSTQQQSGWASLALAYIAGIVAVISLVAQLTTTALPTALLALSCGAGMVGIGVLPWRGSLNLRLTLGIMSIIAATVGSTAFVLNRLHASTAAPTRSFAKGTSNDVTGSGKIGYPPNATVGLCVSIAATGTIPPGETWWVAHRNIVNGNAEGTYFSVTRVESDPARAVLHSRDFRIGDPGDTGKEYEIYLLAVPTETSHAFESVEGNFSLHQLPDGVHGLDNVTVTRGAANC